MILPPLVMFSIYQIFGIKALIMYLLGVLSISGSIIWVFLKVYTMKEVVVLEEDAEFR